MFLKCNKPKLLPDLACRWIEEDSPATMLGFLTEAGLHIGLGNSPRRPDFDLVVDLCENAMAFEGVLILTAVVESLHINEKEDDPLTELCASPAKAAQIRPQVCDGHHTPQIGLCRSSCGQ